MQARHGQSSYRDRTDEFFCIVESRRRSIAPAAANNVPYGGGGGRREDPRSAAANQSEFSKRASLIGLAIHQTSQKLSKLAQRKFLLFLKSRVTFEQHSHCTET